MAIDSKRETTEQPSGDEKVMRVRDSARKPYNAHIMQRARKLERARILAEHDEVLHDSGEPLSSPSQEE